MAALDQALRGLDPGVDEEIVSTGIQQLTVFDRYNVERISQSICVDASTIIEPLGRRGLDPGVDEEIVSTGIQQLTVFDRYNVERISQSICVDASTIIEPLGRELGAPEGSLLARSMR